MVPTIGYGITAMANLNDKIASLANDFANNIIASLRGASLSELLDLSGGAKLSTGKKGRGWATRKWPKCPVCSKNAWPWGKGYCFDHAKASARAKTAKGKKAAKPAAAKRARPGKAAKTAAAKA